MNRPKMMAMLKQASKENVKNVFDTFLKDSIRYAVLDALNEEVESLCGPKHKPEKTCEYVRAGSAQGRVFVGANAEAIIRPRVRVKKENEASREHHLETYDLAVEGNALEELMIEAMLCGVSTRNQKRLHASQKRTSKSEASRIFQEKAGRQITALRERKLNAKGYVALMLDGVHLSEEFTAVIALGIDAEGRKTMLDYEIGASENAEVSQDLCARLIERGFKSVAKQLLVLLDGSAALKKAIRTYWPEALIQRCLVHICRNIKGRLSKRHWGELERLFNEFRRASDLEAAEEVFTRLLRFVSKRSAEGKERLEELKDEMLTVHSLGIPDTLYKSLLSTNAIENSIHNMRRIMGRVTRWRKGNEMASRWVATAMLEAEKGFQRIGGYRLMPQLIGALNGKEAVGKEANEVAKK